MEEQVRHILESYNFPILTLNESEFWKHSNCLLSWNADAMISIITETQRKTPFKFFLRKYTSLYQELSYFPTVRVIFTLIPMGLASHRDGCGYIKMQPVVKVLEDWIQESSDHADIIKLIKGNSKFCSIGRANWIWIPFNMCTALSLNRDLLMLKR